MKLPEGSVTANEAWLALGAGILAYELIAPPGQLLSESVDRGLEKHPLLTTVVIGYTALHLANLLPKNADLFHHVFRRARGEMGA